MNKTLEELCNLRQSQPDYSERQKELKDITSVYDKIPTLAEVKRIQELNDYEFSNMQDSHILAGIHLVKNFPKFHHYLINRHGSAQFPDFDLPMSIYAALTRYVGILLDSPDNYPEALLIIEYIETLYGEPNDDLGAYISEFLELIDLYESDKRKILYNLLTPKLKIEFDTYFSHYLLDKQ